MAITAEIDAEDEVLRDGELVLVKMGLWRELRVGDGTHKLKDCRVVDRRKVSPNWWDN